MLSKNAFFDLAEKIENPKRKTTLQKQIFQQTLKPQVWQNKWAHTFDRSSPSFTIVCQLVTCFAYLFAMLCLDGHKIPITILKPFLFLLLSKTKFIFLQTWFFCQKPTFSLLLQNGHF